MATATTEEVPAEAAASAKKKFSGRKLVLFVILPALVLLLGGAGAAFVFGLFGGGAADQAAVKEEKAPAPKQTVFYDLPEMLVNLNAKARRPTFLKIRVSLEVNSMDDVSKLSPLGPKITDNFQVYLRELRAEDLRGSAGMARLREELLRRVTIAAKPIEIHDVLFREMLVQ